VYEKSLCSSFQAKRKVKISFCSSTNVSEGMHEGMNFVKFLRFALVGKDSFISGTSAILKK